MSLSVGFDVGGSTVRAGLVAFENGGWRILSQRRELLSPDEKQPDVVVGVIRRLIESLVGDTDTDNPVTRVGIGLCGQMTDNGRFVANAPNLGWRNVAIGELLKREVAQLASIDTIRVDNDLNAILLGEQRFGAAVGCRNIVAVYPGTGIGGAVMIDGRIVRGSRGFAGEIGHVFGRGAIRCGCGQAGCVETIAGGHYIEARVAADRQRGLIEQRHYPDRERLRVDDIDGAYLAGDDYAVALWREVSAELARLAATAVALLDPELVLLGGGVIAHAPALRDRLIEEIPACSPAVCREQLRVEVSGLGEDAGLLGAALLVHD